MVTRAAATETRVGETLSPPRLGQINFANCLPINLPIARGKVSVPAEIIYDTPSQLNDSYARSALDLGAMSSFFYLQQKERMKLLPGISISSIGPVGSVLLFCKGSPDALNGARLEVPHSSATSINLVKVLLQEDFGVIPQCILQASPDLVQEGTAGALVIGDRALVVDPDWSRQYTRIDLGEWWYSKFQLPMVFGVWAGRSDFLNSRKEDSDKVSASLRQSLSIGLTDLFDDVKDEAAAVTGLAASRFDSYFKRELNFELSQSHLDGLEHFAKLCRKHGL